MDLPNAKSATEEFLNQKRDLHKKFSEQLNSGLYRNGEIISVKGNSVKTEVWVRNGPGSSYLCPNDLISKDARYMLKSFIIGSTVDPIRIGVDNSHLYAHIDIPGVEKGIKIPIMDPFNMGMCGSIVHGATLQDEQIRDKVLEYYQML